MVKLAGCILLFGTMSAYAGPSVNFFPLAFVAYLAFYVMPGALPKLFEFAFRNRDRNSGEADRLARANAEEFEHSTSLRRELERSRAFSDQRISELTAVLEIQATMDERKAEKLAAARRDASTRRDADISTLLGRLKEMRTGAEE